MPRKKTGCSSIRTTAKIYTWVGKRKCTKTEGAQPAKQEFCGNGRNLDDKMWRCILCSKFVAVCGISVF